MRTRRWLAVLVGTALLALGTAIPGASADEPTPTYRGVAEKAFGHRWAGGPEMTAKATTGPQSDPAGDASPQDARADISSFTVDYHDGVVDMKAQLFQPTDPGSWNDQSALVWVFDTNHDENIDFVVLMHSSVAVVLDGAFRLMCAVPATYDSGTGYATSMDDSCIGQPALLETGALMVFDPDGPGAQPASIDAAPNGNSLAGALGLDANAPMHQGYWVAGVRGGVNNYGIADSGQGDLALNKPIVGVAAGRDAKSVWVTASDGGVFTIGKAGYFGSTGAIKLNKPIVGIAITPTGQGYWLVASDGGIFAFGDASFFGSTGGTVLNKNIVGMAATPTGEGYWLVASDGGIFAFGDAEFFGSTGDIKLNKPIVGIAATTSGFGYVMVATDGGVFVFGDGQFHGSTGDITLNQPIVGLSLDRADDGYVMVAADGGIFNFGGARFAGSAAGSTLPPAIGIVAA